MFPGVQLSIWARSCHHTVNTDVALSSWITSQNFFSCVSLLLSLGCCFPCPRIQVVLILPNVKFHKAFKTFQGLKPVRMDEKHVQEELHAHYYFVLYWMKQDADPEAHSAKATLRTIETATLVIVHVSEEHFLALLFQKEIPISHFKKHTLYRCIQLCWIDCIFKSVTLGTERLSSLFFYPESKLCQSWCWLASPN